MKKIEFTFLSQVWRGIPWSHTLQLFLPGHPVSDLALLYITGDGPVEGESFRFAQAAERLQAPVAVLYNVPNQPLFDGLYEDALIAHTFDQYLETGDDSWPLLFPMVRSAVRAMDEVQARTEQEWGHPVRGFVVTGASKRGWTTWLTAVDDPRVRAIAPQVFDNLCFPRQMKRQRELWGDFSAQIDDYTERDLQAKMDTERGRQLVQWIDPWCRRERLALPKLLIHGSNDPYWATDATRLYWHDLEGPKSLLTVPNEAHSIGDGDRVLNTLAAFFHAVRRDAALPEIRFQHASEEGKARLRIHTAAEARSVRCWIAGAPTRDLRSSTWYAEPVRERDGEYLQDVPLPPDGAMALYGEVEFAGEDGAFTLTTTTAVYIAGEPDRS